jgi:hypothetical protein
LAAKVLALLLICAHNSNHRSSEPGASRNQGQEIDMSSIKIARAAKIAKAAKFPRTWQAVIAAIPAEVVAALTAKQLAAMADAMHAQFQAGHTAGASEAEAQ